jgi:hypothetical protein
VRRTEGGFADAVAALSTTVDDRDLPRLSYAPASHRPTRRLIAALAAVAGVLLVASIVAIMHRAEMLARLAAPPFAAVGTAGALPPYTVADDRANGLVVRSTVTGRVTDIAPRVIGPRTLYGQWTVAVAADGRYFVAAYVPGETSGENIVVYRFSLTAAGKITGLARVSSAYGKFNPCSNFPRLRRCLPALPWLSSVSAAISDDGSQVVISGLRDSAPLIALTNLPYIVFVVNVATHSVRSWQLPSTLAKTSAILSASWSPGGRSLSLQVATCAPGTTVFTPDPGCPATAGDGQYRRVHEWTVAVPRSGLLGPARELPSLTPGGS